MSHQYLSLITVQFKLIRLSVRKFTHGSVYYQSNISKFEDSIDFIRSFQNFGNTSFSHTYLGPRILFKNLLQHCTSAQLAYHNTRACNFEFTWVQQERDHFCFSFGDLERTRAQFCCCKIHTIWAYSNLHANSTANSLNGIAAKEATKHKWWQR